MSILGDHFVVKGTNRGGVSRPPTGSFAGVYIIANHKRAVVLYCLCYMQRRNIGQPSPLVAILFLECYANVSVFSREIKEPPPHISALKIKRYGTGLTQGSNWHGGSG